MREIVLDTETTGLEPKENHRIVEIGCIELYNHMPTGRNYHTYINPERDMPEVAFQVHGLSEVFLRDFPVFKEVAQDFLNFIEDAPLVIHNAKFDMRFINAELAMAGLPEIPFKRAIDTLMIARRKFPGAANSLDALCRRFQVDNSSRELHGALLDSELLAEVYLELIGGRQPDFLGEQELARSAKTAQEKGDHLSGKPGNLNFKSGHDFKSRTWSLTPLEEQRHKALLEKVSDPIWKKYQTS